MKIYTGTGDRGKTSLFSGERISKNDIRIDAYGDIDELNSIIVALIASLPQNEKKIMEELQQIQSDLFQIGAWLATSPDSPATDSLEEISNAQIAFLETAIDRLNGGLPVLKGFILPGGHITAAWAHMARTVCRRSERKVAPILNISAKIKTPESYQNAFVYLNRLSDYLFVLARHCNRINGLGDKRWK